MADNLNEYFDKTQAAQDEQEFNSLLSKYGDPEDIPTVTIRPPTDGAAPAAPTDVAAQPSTPTETPPAADGDGSLRSMVTDKTGAGASQLKIPMSNVAKAMHLIGMDAPNPDDPSLSGKELTLDIGAGDFVPVAETALAVDDVNTMWKKQDKGEEVPMWEKALTYASVPLSLIGLAVVGRGAKSLIKGAKAAKELKTGAEVVDDAAKIADVLKAADPNKVKAVDEIVGVEEAMLKAGRVPSGEEKMARFMLDDADPALLAKMKEMGVSGEEGIRAARETLKQDIGTGKFTPDMEPVTKIKDEVARKSVGASAAPTSQPVKMVDVSARDAEEVVGNLSAYQAWTKGDVGAHLTGKIPHVNLDNFGSTDDIKAAMEFVADKVEIPSGVQGWEETQKAGLAELLGQPLYKMQYVFQNQYTSSRHVYAAKTLLENASKQVADFAKTYDPLKATTEDRAKAMRLVQQLSDVYAYHTGIRAEAGRALNASKIMAMENKKLLQTLDDMIGTEFGGAKGIDDIMHAMKNAESAKQAIEIARHAAHGGKWWNSAVELWMSSVLSSVSTMTVNSVGNMFNLLKEPVEREIAGGIGKIRQMVGGAQEGVDAVQSGEGLHLLVGMMEGLPEALSVFGKSFKEGQPVWSNAKKLELADDTLSTTKFAPMEHAISAKNFGLRSAYKDGEMFQSAANFKTGVKEMFGDSQTLAGSVVDVFGAVARTPLNVLQSTDEFFKVLAYRMHLNSRAFREVAQYGVKDAKEKAEIFLDFKRNPPKDLKLDAMTFADYATFQKSLSEAGRLTQSLINRGYGKFDMPIMKFIIPFQKTISNIFRQGVLERSPLGFLSKQVDEQIKAGGAVADAARARLYTGTSLVMWSTWQASQGNITGPAPKDPAQREIFMRNARPYSVRIPNGYDESGNPKYEWVSYNRLEPASFPIAMGATIGAYMNYMDPENPEHQRDLESVINASVGALSNYIGDRNYLIGMADFVDALRGEKSIYDWAGRYASSWVPAAANDLVRANSDHIKDTTDFADKTLAKLPMFSDQVPDKLNIWGEPELRDQGLWLGFASPVKTYDKETSPIDRELYRLGVEGVEGTDGVRRIFQEALIRKPDRAIKGMKLSSEQYNQYLKTMGPVVKEKLNEYVQSEHYQGLSDYHKAVGIRTMYDGVKNLMTEQFAMQTPEVLDHVQSVNQLKKELMSMGN